MGVVTFIIDYWKEFAIAALMALLLWFGYHVKDLEDKADENSALRKENTRLANLPAKIITLNQKIEKGASHAKDDCLNKPVPNDIDQLLY